MTRVLLAVSIDTEEDNWEPSRAGVTVENIRGLHRGCREFRALGIRPTFFVTHAVASTAWALDTVRAAAEGLGGEVGAHLHPWNTPPFDAPDPAYPTMLNNYPDDIAAAKLRVLTDRLEAGLGTRPTAFRAGRFGLGSGTVRVLRAAGYTLDSSVTPFFSWSRFDNGPDFVGAPVHAYRLDGNGDVRTPSADGIHEVPISCGYTRFAPRHWPALYRFLAHSASRRAHLAGVGARLGVVRRVILSPETNTARDMTLLSRRLVEHGLTFLHLFFHSSSLVPGFTPFAPTPRAVDNIYGTLAGYVDRLSRYVDVRPVPVSAIPTGEVAA